MISVELSKDFLNVSVQFLGGILTGFVDLGVIKKGHTFVNILALIHDHQGYSPVCCEDHARGILLEGFDGLLFLPGDVVSVSLLVFVVLQNLWFLVDFCTVLPCGVSGDEGMTLLNSCQVIKSQLIGFWCMNSYSQSTQHNWVSFLPYRLNLSIWVCFEYLV